MSPWNVAVIKTLLPIPQGPWSCNPLIHPASLCAWVMPDHHTLPGEAQRNAETLLPLKAALAQPEASGVF